ncbi:Raffinose synthase family protein isoform 1 [Hibiscus syriacus]|uniref:Raffinose synthase family protein isoform 1 n=1 Tax=Hibiscus syriacus TaxID=106335 RepID=A0A6A2YJ09_HIBSY|nr:Raffinose synthase family protein isoform 1 [Hibiscus syriacus]
MDLSPFKQDIDELIHEFVQSESSTLNDTKRIWLSMKFSYIYEASPTNLAFFTQSLYAHIIDLEGFIASMKLNHSNRLSRFISHLEKRRNLQAYIHMDLAMEVDFDKIKKMSTENAVAKRKSIKEVGEVVDVQNIKQITEYEKPLSEIVKKIDESWNNQREAFPD